MKEHAETIIEEVKNSDTIEDEKKDQIIEKLKEWQSDANAESNTLAMTFEKFWMELEPIFAEIGLA